jgi:hypothetical protein
MQACSPCCAELLLGCWVDPRGSFVLLFALEGDEALFAGAVGDSRGGGAIYTAALVLRAKAEFALTHPS